MSRCAELSRRPPNRSKVLHVQGFGARRRVWCTSAKNLACCANCMPRLRAMNDRSWSLPAAAWGGQDSHGRLI
eukprot:1918375-Pleurochrysis_carterae.AAC.1